MRYALDHGAKRVILVGIRLGGAISASFLQHSPLAAKVTKLVPDAPILDLSTVVEYGASQRNLPVLGSLPGSLTWTGEKLTALRTDVDWDKVNHLKNTDWLKVHARLPWDRGPHRPGLRQPHPGPTASRLGDAPRRSQGGARAELEPGSLALRSPARCLLAAAMTGGVHSRTQALVSFPVLVLTSVLVSSSCASFSACAADQVAAFNQLPRIDGVPVYLRGARDARHCRVSNGRSACVLTIRSACSLSPTDLVSLDAVDPDAS